MLSSLKFALEKNVSNRLHITRKVCEMLPLFFCLFKTLVETFRDGLPFFFFCWWCPEAIPRMLLIEYIVDCLFYCPLEKKKTPTKGI